MSTELMRRGALASVFCIVVAAPTTAHAFNYPEHAYISKKALHIFVEQNGDAFEFLASTRRVLNTPRLCPDEQLLDLPTDQDCFSLADLPALSGDHAGSPPGVLLRWFSSLPDSPHLRMLSTGLETVDNALLSNVGAAIANADPGTDSELECGNPTAPTSVDQFIRIVRRYNVAEGEAVLTDDLDTDIAEVDADYLCAALNGSHHFRVPELHSSDAAYAQTPNALGTYSTYHLQALAFARLSVLDKNNREKWQGLAVLSELFGVHFLQDSAAAGHIVLDYGELNPASIRATHDEYNEEGLTVRIPALLCQHLEKPEMDEVYPRLHRLCTASSEEWDRWNWRTAILRGDHSLSLALGEEDELDVTREYAALLMVESLTEVLEVTRELEPEEVATEPEVVPEPATVTEEPDAAAGAQALTEDEPTDAEATETPDGEAATAAAVAVQPDEGSSAPPAVTAETDAAPEQPDRRPIDVLDEAACLEGLRGCLDPAPGRSLELSCAIAWFETPECAPRHTATAALRRNELRPLEMLPISAERVYPIHIFSGASLLFSSSYRAMIDWENFFKGPDVETLNAIGVGFDYTSPPSGIGQLTLNFAVQMVLRAGVADNRDPPEDDQHGVGFGARLRIDLHPLQRYLLIGGGATFEFTNPGHSERDEASSFFFGSVGFEMVNVDDVAFRVVADAGCHYDYDDSDCRLASALGLMLAFKWEALLGADDAPH